MAANPEHLTDEEREMLARCERVTPGPWAKRLPDYDRNFLATIVTDRPNPYDYPIAEVRFPNNATSETVDANAELIAHARTDLPTMLERTAALRAEVLRLQRELEQAKHELADTAENLNIYMGLLNAASADNATLRAEVEQAKQERKALCRLLGLSNIDGHIHNKRAEQAEAALAAEGWIPVSERLPSEAGETLIVSAGKVISGYFLISRWYQHGAYSVQFSHVTHWRPLPAPPKEG